MQGEVAISHRIDAKSYTSLHTLVDDMFPPTSMVEQVMVYKGNMQQVLEHRRGYNLRELSNASYWLLLWIEIEQYYLLHQYICRKITIHGIIGECHCQILISCKICSRWNKTTLVVDLWNRWYPKDAQPSSNYQQWSCCRDSLIPNNAELNCKPFILYHNCWNTSHVTW